MFCHHCGNQLIEGARFCQGCGKQIPINPAVSAPVAVLSPIPQSTPTETAPVQVQAENLSNPLNGVRGWLFLYCIGATIATPLTLLSMLAGVARNAEVLIPISIAAVSIASGVAVWIRHKDANYFVIASFIVYLLIGLAFLFSDSDGARMFSFRVFIYVIAWASYFHKSKRVKATFGYNFW